MSQPISKKTTLLADAGLFYAAAIWGSTFFVVKDALSGIDPVVMVAYRFLLAGSVMLGFLLITRRLILQGLGRALFLSTILFTLYVTQTIGLKYTTASNSGFITGLFVLFVPVFMRSLFKRRPRVMEWVASAISICGLWVLTGGLVDFNRGDLLTLVAAITYALHLLLSDKYMKAGADPYVISCQQFLMVGLFSLIAAFLFDLQFTVLSASVMWIVVFLAFLPTLSAFVIQMLAQRFTSPLKVSLIFALEPVFAALFAWTLGGETPVVHRALGGLLIALALATSGLRWPLRQNAVGQTCR
ncbi:MAG: DMT family transporter [Candidatus Zixiibacteriota bacterium]